MMIQACELIENRDGLTCTRVVVLKEVVDLTVGAHRVGAAVDTSSEGGRADWRSRNGNIISF